MDLLQSVTTHHAYLGLAAVCFISAVFPLVNAELAVVGVVAAVPSANILLLVAVATAGQMAGKSTMYWLGRRGVALARGRFADAVERWGHRFRGSGRSVGGFVFLSSASGLPPFYVISTLAGTFRTSFLAFVIAGTAGRFVRFAAIGLFPYVVRSIAG